jgi:hypothetical protein
MHTVDQRGRQLVTSPNHQKQNTIVGKDRRVYKSASKEELGGLKVSAVEVIEKGQKEGWVNSKNQVE